LTDHNTSQLENRKIDVVYTWVDDQFPGYLDILNQYADTKHDLNPNRTRDNLELLKYSLRSLEKNLPWIRNVYLFTCRPQIPEWMNVNCENLKILHHDEIIDQSYLPTFSSHSIISNIHKLPGLSEHFLYVEDDMLFDNKINYEDFYDKNGKIIFYPKNRFTCDASERNNASESPWNLALAECNHLLNQAFRTESRFVVNHVPLLINKKIWQEIEDKWPNQFHQTRSSRFRAMHNIAVEYLYPQYMLYKKEGVLAPFSDTKKYALYHPLENYRVWAWYGIWRINQIKPRFLALNDNFDGNPNQSVVKIMQKFLENHFPKPSRFERDSSA